MTEQPVHIFGSGTPESATDTRSAIMEATYEALRTHGYADLTVQAIADEFAKSKSLLYYHYDSKDGLLVDFLGYAIDGFAVRDPVDPTIPPDDRLDALFDDFLAESLDDDRREFFVAIFELRSRAPSHVAYRDQFGRADRLITESIAEILREGIERGLFDDVDVDRTAELLYSTLTGGLLRRLTASEPRSVPATRRAIDRFVRSELLFDGDD